MTNAELVTYYRELLIAQYANRPKARANVEAVLGVLVLLELAAAVEAGYGIEDAEGVQLDVLASYPLVARLVTGIAFSRQWFGFSYYGDVEPFLFQGFMQYGDEPPDVQFLRYEDSRGQFLLNDLELRGLIRLKVRKNRTVASVQEIDGILWELFGGEAYMEDNLDGSMTLWFQEAVHRTVIIAWSQGLLPKPAGVSLQVGFLQQS